MHSFGSTNARSMKQCQTQLCTCQSWRVMLNPVSHRLSMDLAWFCHCWMAVKWWCMCTVAQLHDHGLSNSLTYYSRSMHVVAIQANSNCDRYFTAPIVHSPC